MEITRGKGSQIVKRKRGKRFFFKEFTPIQKFAGVCYYLHDKGLKDDKEKHNAIKSYAVYMKWEIPEERSIIHACVLVQQDFKSFTNWVAIYLSKTKKNA